MGGGSKELVETAIKTDFDSIDLCFPLADFANWEDALGYPYRIPNAWQINQNYLTFQIPYRYDCSLPSQCWQKEKRKRSIWKMFSSTFQR